MKGRIAVLIGIVAVLSAPAVWAHEEAHGAGGEQELTGEVVDIVCYLSHGAEGLGAKHADCAKKCIKGGLPVGLKVGDQIYLATMADHTAANMALLERAGQQVTVHGKVMVQDGQHLVAISHIE